jgi:hypothetical protein
MSEKPDGIVLQRDRDLVGRERDIWVRRALFSLAPLVAVLAIFNVFGQNPQDSQAAASAATLKLHAPDRVRGGLLYEARFEIQAQSALENAVLVLAPGWFEGMTVNTVEPAPESEHSFDGDTAFELGPVQAGESFVLYMQFQVNPTNVGHRLQRVRLFDGTTLLLTLPHTITVFP